MDIAPEVSIERVPTVQNRTEFNLSDGATGDSGETNDGDSGGPIVLVINGVLYDACLSSRVLRHRAHGLHLHPGVPHRALRRHARHPRAATGTEATDRAEDDAAVRAARRRELATP
jgi:hypothetical protein